MSQTIGLERLVLIGAGATAEVVATRARDAGWEVATAPLYPCEQRDDDAPESFDAVVARATVIVVTTESAAHGALGVMLRGKVDPDALVVLMPGQPGGALQLARALGGPVVAETSIAPVLDIGDERVELREIPLATVPADQAPTVVGRLAPLLCAEPAPNAVWTLLQAPDVVLRVAPQIVGAHGDQTPATTLADALAGPAGDLAQRVDDERQAIARALRLTIPRTSAWLAATLEQPPGPLSAVLGPLGPLPVPPVADPGWLADLAPFGLVPTLAVGRWASVPTPVTAALLAMADALLNNDFELAGRSSELLGIGEATWPLRAAVPA